MPLHNSSVFGYGYSDCLPIWQAPAMILRSNQFYSHRRGAFYRGRLTCWSGFWLYSLLLMLSKQVLDRISCQVAGHYSRMLAGVLWNLGLLSLNTWLTRHHYPASDKLFPCNNRLHFLQHYSVYLLPSYADRILSLLKVQQLLNIDSL